MTAVQRIVSSSIPWFTEDRYEIKILKEDIIVRYYTNSMVDFNDMKFFHSVVYRYSCVTVTKIKQERTNQDRTKIDPFFDFILHFSIFLFELFNIISQLSCEAKQKISSENIEKCRRNSKKGPILVLSGLVLSCFIFVTVRPWQGNILVTVY